MNKILIIFSYSGFEINAKREDYFWNMIKIAKEVSGDESPVVVVNEDTIFRGKAKAFLDDKRVKHFKLDVQIVWAVDTCQMWLHGWGYIIDNFKETERIIQLPGDIDMIQDIRVFEQSLRTFISLGKPFDIITGDFTIGEKFGPKSLIDTYGTYQLLSIWFPSLTKEIFRLQINRPRSEFINIKKEVLRELLDKRKFAYEQTLNMLISSWDWKNRKEWKYKILAHPLGTIKDDSSHRDYTGVMDQIERTERLIKLRWREIEKPTIKKNPTYEEKLAEMEEFQKFTKKFQRLDRVSSSAREAAAYTIQALLGIG